MTRKDDNVIMDLYCRKGQAIYRCCVNNKEHDGCGYNGGGIADDKGNNLKLTVMEMF